MSEPAEEKTRCESVNEAPPGKLCDQDPDALLDIRLRQVLDMRLRQDPPLRRLKTLFRISDAVSDEITRLLQEWEARLKAEQEAREQA